MIPASRRPVKSWALIGNQLAYETFGRVRDPIGYIKFLHKPQHVAMDPRREVRGSERPYITQAIMIENSTPFPRGSVFKYSTNRLREPFRLQKNDVLQTIVVWEVDYVAEVS